MGMQLLRGNAIKIGVLAVVMLLLLTGAFEYYYGNVVNMHPASAHGLGISRRQMADAVQSDFSSIGRAQDSTEETYIGYSAPDYLSTIILKGDENDLSSVILLDRFSGNERDDNLALRRVERVGRVIDPRATRWMIEKLNNHIGNWMREHVRDSTIIDGRKFLISTGVMNGASSMMLAITRVPRP